MQIEECGCQTEPEEVPEKPNLIYWWTRRPCERHDRYTHIPYRVTEKTKVT